jgi:hypothetical protein
MPIDVDSMVVARTAKPLTQLDRARRRRDEAAQGSPDWDAASEAVMELEADDRASDPNQAPRQLFLVDPRSAGRGVPPA